MPLVWRSKRSPTQQTSTLRCAFDLARFRLDRRLANRGRDLRSRAGTSVWKPSMGIRDRTCRCSTTSSARPSSDLAIACHRRPVRARAGGRHGEDLETEHHSASRAISWCSRCFSRSSGLIFDSATDSRYSLASATIVNDTLTARLATAAHNRSTGSRKNSFR